MYDFNYNDFRIDELLELKKDKTISVIIPSFFEEENIVDVVAKIGNVVNKGLIDEILVIDGSRTDENMIYDTMKAAAKTAFKSLERFEHQVVNRKPKPVLKLIHQLHPKLCQLLGTEIKKGKGDALWKAVACSRGNILLFLDADIQNIDERFIVGLAGPILSRQMFFSKAYYYRPPFQQAGRKIFGGRVTRLFMRPMLHVLGCQYKVLEGLEELIYPLSGEFCTYREVFEKLLITHRYGVETAIILDVYKKFGIDKLAQVDLGQHIHTHQSDEKLIGMVRQIAEVLFWFLREYFGFSLDEKRKGEIMERYRRRALANVKTNDDMERIETYQKQLENVMQAFPKVQIEKHVPLKRNPTYQREREKLRQYATKATYDFCESLE